jgi:hypothetical protein
MSLSQETEVPENGPVDIPESLIATLARDPPKRLPGGRVLTSSKKKASDESGEESDAPPPVQGPNPLPGGGDSDSPHDDGDDKEEEKEESSSGSEMGEADEDEPEDPDNVGTGKFYAPQTPRGKSTVKMFRWFCDLPKQDANAIVVYFGMYSVARLAAFQQDLWKDTFAHATQIEMVQSVRWSCRRPSMIIFVVLRGFAATLYGSSGPQDSLTSIGCAHDTSSPSVPRWNVRKKAR